MRRRPELIRFGWRRGSACSRKNTKQIHFRGFFSSITAQVAAAVIPPSATSSKTSSEVPIGVILANYRSPRRSDFYPKAQIHKWPSKKCRSLSKKVEFGQTFVQKLLVE